MKSLEELCNEFRSDKEAYHGYVSGCYDHFLKPLRDKPIDLLEIGVFQGASMRMWDAYFPAGSHLTGIDIHPEEGYVKSYKMVSEGVYGSYLAQLSPLPESCSYVRADAYDPQFFEGIADDSRWRFDVIIDDGPHTHDSQIYFWTHYDRLLKPGGLMFLEDIQFLHTMAALRDIRKPSFVMDKSGLENLGSDSRLIVWQAPKE